MYYVLFFIAGVLFGVLVFAFIHRQSKDKSQTELQVLKSEVENNFKALSYDVSKKSIDELIKISKEILDSKTSENSQNLEEKKKLIDHSLENITKSMQERLEKVQKLMSDINQSVPEKYGEVSKAIENITKQSENLRKTTESLNVALSGSQSRGQWGERMAEDILRVVGMKEGVEYLKQKTADSGNSRPDFTFLLPNSLKINMDVKFPLKNYMTYLEAESETEKEKAKKLFLGSVKNRIKEVTNRDYINPDDNTVDYVLVFIPNEQVYAFIHENDSSLLDEALKQKVVLCSPLTLYAVLALIRQALDNFNLQQSSRKVQALLGGFSQQWKLFVKAMTTVGDRIDSSRKAYDDLVGTRTRQLDRQVKAIDDVNNEDGIQAEITNDKEIIEITNNENGNLFN